MSNKRSRANFESDLQAQQSPYVVYGTPLPPLDPEVRDDGSYVPIWKQEVRDERGRKRLHGAFTGGWSAGYFNTVGSKEGWSPSTFVSSRTNRRKEGQDGAKTQRVEDFMDEEDLAERAESERIQTASGFAGLGSTEQDAVRRGGLADIFRVSGETTGVKLLKRMGWKEGQGVGPKVRRKARLEVGTRSDMGEDGGESYLFAPDNVAMVVFVKKHDRKGLGYEGESKLTPLSSTSNKISGGSSDEEEDGPLIRPNLMKKKPKPKRGGIGIGILNDTGSDDEDPYEIGPRISYNRVIGGDKKKKKEKAAKVTAVNPNLRSVPKFISRKDVLAKAAKNLRKCHDGRLPLDGFIFGSDADNLTSMINSEAKYAPPNVPLDWKSSKKPKSKSVNSSYISAADAAKASTLDPKSRAALLGEGQLPGKSVFDFLSPDARDRLAAATGKTNLPPALGEIPEGYALTPEERQQELISQLPVLDKDAAIAALTRGTTGSGPYVDDEDKRSRYRAYLEYAAGVGNASLPAKPALMKDEEWRREMRELHSCAMLFKPMTGSFASRFTTSSSSLSMLKSGSSGGELLSKPPPKPTDPAEEAAKMGMYGTMTRSVTEFYPTRLLCKRFNVRPPAIVQPDGELASSMTRSTAPSTTPSFVSAGSYMGGMQTEPAAVTLDELLKQAQNSANTRGTTSKGGLSTPNPVQPAPELPKIEIDASVNEALEGKRAQDEVLRAIFGDSSDDED